MKKKINIISLGCSKNLVDSEHLAARCAAAGYGVEFDSDSPDARVVVVNTCGFIGDAKEQSIDTILMFAGERQRGEIDRLYVIGCLSERFADELREEIPEVDDFFGARSLDGIIDELAAEAGPDHDTDRVLSTPAHYAFLKISEGCDRRCGFCAIPLIRGPHVSVPMEQLLREAEKLAARGVRELIVVAQDTTYYGVDLYGERRLAELLGRLARIEGIEWIRLHYAYPAGFPDDVIEVMRSEPKICKYLDIPLQHIAEGQLSSMKRGLGSEGTRRLVERLRAAIPGLTLRTTMLVGYPGETEADFKELTEFVREARFERLGVFPYSAEEGTWSAEKLTDDLSDQDKLWRVERLMQLQAGISAEINAARIGNVERVIVDERAGDRWVCRSQGDSPEVDGEVHVAAHVRKLRPGEFIEVRITGATEYYVEGEMVV